MTTVTRTFETESGTVYNTLAYNTTIQAFGKNKIVKDYFNVETDEALVDEDVVDFNPKDWNISVSSKEVTDEETGEVKVYTNKWLVDLK